MSFPAFRARSTIVGVRPSGVTVPGDWAAVAGTGVADTPVAAMALPTVILRSVLRRSAGRRTNLRKSLGTGHLRWLTMAHDA
jgi:hypothetical protein